MRLGAQLLGAQPHGLAQTRVTLSNTGHDQGIP